MPRTATGLFPSAGRATALYISLLLGSVLVLANLEKTLRTSYGAIRWQIKFSILGVGILFAARVYTSAQILLFSAASTDVFILNSIILVVANILIIISAIRNRLRDVKIYVSQDVLHGSLTILVIGIYLLGVGVFAKVIVYLGTGQFCLKMVSSFLWPCWAWRCCFFRRR